MEEVMDLVERVARAICNEVALPHGEGDEWIMDEGFRDLGYFLGVAQAAIEATGVRELVEALGWYADEKNWNTDWNENNPAYGDRGNRARKALAKHGSVK
jgi:hypothetical protein